MHYNQPMSGSGSAPLSGGGPGPNQGQMDPNPMNMFKGDNADMLMNYGLSQGQNLFKQQSDKWMPGVTGFWSSLKIYFAVNNSYVVKKLSMILYPLGVKKSQNWTRKSAESDGYENTGTCRMSCLPCKSTARNITCLYTTTTRRHAPVSALTPPPLPTLHR